MLDGRPEGKRADDQPDGDHHARHAAPAHELVDGRIAGFDAIAGGERGPHPLDHGQRPANLRRFGESHDGIGALDRGKHPACQRAEEYGGHRRKAQQRQNEDEEEGEKTPRRYGDVALNGLPAWQRH